MCKDGLCFVLPWLFCLNCCAIFLSGIWSTSNTLMGNKGRVPENWCSKGIVCHFINKIQWHCFPCLLPNIKLWSLTWSLMLVGWNYDISKQISCKNRLWLSRSGMPWVYFTNIFPSEYMTDENTLQRKYIPWNLMLMLGNFSYDS